MPETSQVATARKDNAIQIRASSETKAVLNRAASLRGQRLSEFRLDSARRQAEDTILDQRCTEAMAEQVPRLRPPVGA